MLRLFRDFPRMHIRGVSILISLITIETAYFFEVYYASWNNDSRVRNKTGRSTMEWTLIVSNMVEHLSFIHAQYLWLLILRAMRAPFYLLLGLE